MGKGQEILSLRGDLTVNNHAKLCGKIHLGRKVFSSSLWLKDVSYVHESENMPAMLNVNEKK